MHLKTSIWKSLIEENNSFSTGSMEHYVAVSILLFLGVFLIFYALKYWNREERLRYGSYIALFVLLHQISRFVIRYYLGIFDPAIDLPLHICNFLPLLVYIAFRNDSRDLFSIIFYWIVAGTLQANITPTLLHSFPHHDYFRYFSVHGGLSILAIYGAVCLGWEFKFSDAIRSALCINLLAVFIYPINLIVNGNYLYLNRKPDAATLFDHLGPWPWYIFNIEMIMAVLFPIMTIPFIIYYRKRKCKVKTNKMHINT